MPLAFGLLLIAAVVIYMGVKNESLGGVFSDTHQPISPDASSFFSPGGAIPNPITGLASTVGGAVSLTGASVQQRAKVAAMLTMANNLNGKPYVWGGGHSSWATQLGYDCSGFVSAVLHAGGFLSSPQDTAGLASSLQGGPGQYVTVYDRTDGGSTSTDHTIINIAGQWWESGGTSNAGIHQISTPSSSYLASFNRLLHPAGL